MDKELKRVIGFVKPKGDSVGINSKKKEPCPKRDDVPEKNETSTNNDSESTNRMNIPKVENNGKKVVSWLFERDFINRSALCKAAKVDRANFDKYMKIGEFPEKIANPIAEQLKKYGYESV